jgi:hypothetical protein
MLYYYGWLIGFHFPPSFKTRKENSILFAHWAFLSSRRARSGAVTQALGPCISLRHYHVHPCKESRLAAWTAAVTQGKEAATHEPEPWLGTKGQQLTLDPTKNFTLMLCRAVIETGRPQVLVSPEDWPSTPFNFSMTGISLSNTCVSQ